MIRTNLEIYGSLLLIMINFDVSKINIRNDV